MSPLNFAVRRQTPAAKRHLGSADPDAERAVRVRAQEQRQAQAVADALGGLLGHSAAAVALAQQESPR